MTITQESMRAILNWQSFDIGSQAWVNFNHLQGAAAATLNRIAAGANPTQILGRLTANGQVYLYNQNGIIFGQGAQVNVGALVASTLNISDELFAQQLSTLTGVRPVFEWDQAAATAFGIDPSNSMVRIDAGASLSSDNGGRILVFAPKVVNNGTISTPGGQAILAAGGKVYLAVSNSPQLRGLLVEVDALEPAPGQRLSEVVNDRLGRIVAERGNVSLVALAVNQSGRVSATTSVNLNGSIRLLARDSAIPDTTVTDQQVPIGSRTGTLVLGEGSVTEVLPDSGDTKTIQDQQTFNPSRIEMVGRTVHLQKDATVRVPGGAVEVSAQAGALIFDPPTTQARDGVRVYFEPGAQIDVSGLQDVGLPIERNVLEVELRGNELRDSPLQRESFLRNQTIRVDIRKGTPLADISGQVAQIGRGIGEKSTAGGTVRIRSEGDIVMREGSSVDVSGGGLRYGDGYLDTTKLAHQGRIVDISAADPNQVYDGFADSFVKHYQRWGVTESFRVNRGRGELTPGYVEGKNAGSAELVARALALDGQILGRTVSGAFQRDPSSAPQPGEIVIGNSEGGSAGGDYKTPDVLLQRAGAPLAADFRFDSALPDAYKSQLTLSLDRLQAGGIDRVAVYSEGRIRLAQGNDLALAPGGSLRLTGRKLDIEANIDVPAADIRLSTRSNASSPNSAQAHELRVADNVRISARGRWINDSPLLGGETASAPLFIDGGSLTLDSVADLILGTGSLLDVSGGAHAPARGALDAGDAGSIALSSGRFGLAENDLQRSRLVLGGELRGYAAGRGGKLTLAASEVVIGSIAAPSAEQLVLDAGFFQRGGFSEYSITGANAFTVAPGASVYGAVDSLVIDQGYALRATGSDIFALGSISRLPAHARDSVDLALQATARGLGRMLVAEGATVTVDPGGSIALGSAGQLTVLGTLSAPGGAIRLATLVPGDLDSFDPGQSIWLGAQSRLLARGTFVAEPNDAGLRKGTVYDGGSVEVIAGRGYLVAESGALIDGSGTSAVLDLPGGTAQSPSMQATTVASHAGSILLQAREGILFDGALAAAPGGALARGGRLEVVLDLDQPRLGFPFADRVISLGRFGSVVPGALAPGAAIDSAAFNGRAWLDAGKVAAGGFDELSLRVANAAGSARVELSGAVHLALRSRMEIDAPVLAGVNSPIVALEAAYVAIGHGDIRRQGERSSTGGEGTSLQVRANLIDLIGNVSVQGFETIALESAGDLRLRGVQELSASLPESERGRRLTGGFYSGADSLTLRAAQVYPTTLTHFTLALRNNPDGRLRFESSGMPGPVLSAGGQLTAAAPVIEQAGVVKAPFGGITLAATERLTLAPGSLTSVSPDGATVPFGRTELSGRDWAYPLGNNVNLIFEAPPEKRIALSAPDVQLAAGAVVDLSGGGDLYAYEFIPGPGGSRDVLDAANAPGTYAILPSLGSQYGPYDPLYDSGTSLAPGELVYLSGGRGLASGYYTLLPARYALLPGAYLVTARPGFRDLLPGQGAVRPDGGQIVPGHFAARGRDGTPLRDARSTGFDIRPGAVARTQSEFRDSFAGSFFTAASGAQLPRDAGRLAVSAVDSLLLQGEVVARAGAGGRGAEIDLSALKLAVLGAGAPAEGLDGFIVLAAGDLRRLNADSLLLGGIRTGESGAARIDVGAGEVRVLTSAEDPLSAPELILAARDTLTVAAGSVIEGAGAFRGSARDLRLGDSSQPGSGDGALLRVSSGNPVAVLRNSVARARGSLLVEHGATVRAAKSMVLDATFANSVAGSIELGAEGALRLGASRISVGSAPGGTPGIVLSDASFSGLATLESLALLSYTTFDLYGGATFGSPALESLTIEAGGIGGYANDGASATLIARTVSLANPNGTAFSSRAGATPGGGQLAIDANRIDLGASPQGTSFSIRGFGDATLQAGEIVAAGNGALSTPANLTLRAARIGAATGADYSLTSDATLTTALRAPSAELAAAAAIGGRLALVGARLIHGGRIELPAGSVTLRATGPGADLLLQSGSSIAAASAVRSFGDLTAGTAAGSVALESVSGGIVFESGASIDLRGLAGGDAGTLRIRAAGGSALLEGALLASAEPGSGAVAPLAGSAFLDLGSLAGFSALNTTLNQAGFAERRELRVRGGDLAVAAADRVTARNVSMAADGGKLTVAGTIDASGEKGGSIVLAADNVAVLSGALLDASSTADPPGVADANGRPFGTRGQGGNVLIASSAGGIDVQAGATFDVSSSGVAANGAVTLRAPRAGITVESDPGTGVLVSPFAGTVRSNAGAAAPALVVEAVKTYERTTIDGATMSAVDTHNNAFVAGMGGSALPGGFVLRPGVEIRSAGDLTLPADWSLFGARPGGQPGALTLRAAGNLLLNGSLSDGFTSAATTAALQAGPGPSWSYRLAGGADLGAADPLATVKDAGDVALAASKLVRTGTGSIDIAAGRDLLLASQASVIYTAGERAPALAGFNVTPLSGVQAEFPAGGGDLSIRTGRDIVAAPTNQLVNNWLFRQGKLENLAITGQFRNVAWWPRFRDFEQGVGTLGGGDVTISAGGNVRNLSVMLPTSGRLPGTAAGGSNPAGLDVRGGGDLMLTAGGDIGSAIVYVDRGAGRIRAGGALGSSREASGAPLYSVLALGDAQLIAQAGGDLRLETVLNPTIVTQAGANRGDVARIAYFLTYGPRSAVDLRSAAGDLSLENRSAALNAAFASGTGALPLQNEAGAALFGYPGTLRALAAAGDIAVNGGFSMYPAARGTLQLLAGSSVSAAGTMFMADVLPSALPSATLPDVTFTEALSRLLFSRAYESARFHSSPILHANDPEPVRIAALSGDVVGPSDRSTPIGIFPKAAQISAGGDVRNAYFVNQNVRTGDVTRISAGRDIVFDLRRSINGLQQTNDGRFDVGGPGRLEILAGRHVDFGNSSGAITRGNLVNPFLPEGGANILVQAGAGKAEYAGFIEAHLPAYRGELTAYMRRVTGNAALSDAEAFAQYLALPPDRQVEFGNRMFYSELKASGREAVQRTGGLERYSRGFAAIDKLFAQSVDGDVSLFFSQIKTEQGGDIDIMAPGGLVNAGLASPGAIAKQASDLGVLTIRGGTIRSYVRDDFEVNQSRVFTLQGGDILIWASFGDIDAGRGAKTASATPPPRVVIRNDQIVLDTTNSVAGSGIGVLLAADGVVPGDVDLIAPRGEVNAGDAGIRVAGNLNIAAERFVGADNVKVGGSSSGVPAADTGAAAAGAAASASGAAAAATQGVADVARAGQQSGFRPSFISARVLGFGDEGSSGEAESDEERKKRQGR